LEPAHGGKVDGRACGDHDIAGGIEEGDGREDAGLDEFAEGGLEAVLGDHAAETALGTDDEAEGGGDILGSEDESGAFGGAEAAMFGDLPGEDEDPSCQEKAIDQPAVPEHGMD
jgi:hypothetical protein